MKRNICLVLLSGVAVLAGCASPPPPTAQAAATAAPVAVVPAAAASAAAPVVASDDAKTPAIPYGYQRKVVNGEDQYCRKDLVTGSRVQKFEVCLSLEQLQAQESKASSYIEQAQSKAGVMVPNYTQGASAGALPR